MLAKRNPPHSLSRQCSQDPQEPELKSAGARHRQDRTPASQQRRSGARERRASKASTRSNAPQETRDPTTRNPGTRTRRWHSSSPSTRSHSIDHDSRIVRTTIRTRVAIHSIELINRQQQQEDRPHRRFERTNQDRSLRAPGVVVEIRPD